MEKESYFAPVAIPCGLLIISTKLQSNTSFAIGSALAMCAKAFGNVLNAWCGYPRLISGRSKVFASNVKRYIVARVRNI